MGGGAAAVALLALATSAHAFMRLAGPYSLDLKALDRCEDQGLNKLNFSTRLHKVSATAYAYSGPWRWPYDLDSENWRVVLSAERWGSSGWGKNAMSFDSKKPCSDALEMCGPMFRSIAAAANFPPRCPVPAGDYEVKNWVVNISLPFAMLPYGNYRIDVLFYYKGDKVGCLRFTCDVFEKKG